MSPAAAAFEQWSQGGGSPRAEWTITRAEAAFLFAELRGRERAAVLEGERQAGILRDALRVVRERLRSEQPDEVDRFVRDVLAGGIVPHPRRAA